MEEEVCEGKDWIHLAQNMGKWLKKGKETLDFKTKERFLSYQ